jgi:glycosyltransferase involved in cell wall biosynthesis
LLSAADLLCQPNLTPEPFGIAFVEALAAGLPVVASRAGGAAEIVDDSCGLLVPPGDAASLGAALERLVAEPMLRGRLSANAPARARQLSDPVVQLGHLAQVLSTSPVGVGA